MKPISILDLKTQNEKIWDELAPAIINVVKSTKYINGPEVQDFKKNLADYLNVKRVIPCGNGTDALQIALMALNLPEDSEIIVPSFTFVATAEVVKLLKYKVVFVDIDPRTFNIDIESIKAAISDKTKAIIPVHLFGQSADMEPILKFAEERELFVIEDNAQALGGTYTFSDGTTKKTGTMGTAGTTSFYPTKNLSAFGDGGAIFTDNDVLADKIQMVANHGQKDRYYYETIGVNSRLDTIQAAILNIKLKYLDEYNKRRREIAKFYNDNLQDLPIITPYEAPNYYHVYHQYTIRVLDGKRDELKEFLAKNNIPTMVYYALPIHLQEPYFSDRRVDMQNTEMVAKEVLSLPIHPELEQDQLEYIVENIRKFFK